MLPKGAIGELCVAGLGVSKGYLGRTELTEQCFVTDPAGTEEIYYRTGDRARLHNGQLYCLGRADEQVKVRGYRIEPAEILSILRQSPDIAEVAVLAVGSTATDRILVAYVVAHDGAEVDISVLRRTLQASLPDYMVPSLFVPLTELPRSPNGKLDKARLPKADLSRHGSEANGDVREPSDKLVADILKIWRDALGPHVGPDDNFFEVGGHSLLGVSLIMSIEREMGVDLPLSTLFEAPTPATLAERVRSPHSRSRFNYIIPVKPTGSQPPIFCIEGVARQLAEYVDTDQPVYLMWRSSEESANAEFDSVEKIASSFLSEIRLLQPHGPYYLLGFSFGGMVTYEIAMQLITEGESIGLLVLVDPPNPPQAAIDSKPKSRIRDSLSEMRPSDSIASYLARALVKFPYRRIRNLWRQILWIYYRVSARSRHMYGAAGVFALIGTVTFAMAGSGMSYEDWRPISEPLLIKQGQALDAKFIPGQSGLHEIELTVDRATSASALQKTILAYKEPSDLEVTWSVWQGDRRLVTGTAKDHYYLDLTPHRRIGDVGYVLFQIPMSRNKAHFDSFGMRGSFTWSRGMGSVKLDADQSYTLRARVERTIPELDVTNPRISVRYNRRAFYAYRKQVLVQSLAGIALVSLSILLAGVAWLRKRQAIPPTLLSYRNLKHDMRLSQRYNYLPYPGDASLIIPERHPDIVEKTVSSWRGVTRGTLRVNVIKGAHRHLDLLDRELGAEAAQLTAAQLRAARNELPAI
jgi:thioesterase domain-containing protein/acyl carrier protein